MRPKTATRWPNLFLAGDWTDTGLPATIEGAVRSGEKAARFGAAPAVLYSRAMNQIIRAAKDIRRSGQLHPRRHRRRCCKQQRADGHWVYELEADATIPAEYVLLVHYLAETPNLELERKIGVYLRRIQGAMAAGRCYHDGAFDISATVKAYFALKMIGDDIDAPHMARAREAIHAARRRRSRPMSSPASCWRLWPDVLGERADRAGGTDPAAALVSHSICPR